MTCQVLIDTAYEMCDMTASWAEVLACEWMPFYANNKVTTQDIDWYYQMDRLVQERCNSIANTLELHIDHFSVASF